MSGESPPPPPSIRRSERLRSRERSLSVEPQRGSSVSGDDVARDLKAATPRAKDARTTPRRRSTRRASSERDTSDEETVGATTPVLRLRRSSRTDSASSADGSVTPVTAKRRRRTAVDPPVDLVVIEEVEETVEGEPDVIAQHTRSHGSANDSEGTMTRSAVRMTRSKSKLSSSTETTGDKTQSEMHVNESIVGEEAEVISKQLKQNEEEVRAEMNIAEMPLETEQVSGQDGAEVLNDDMGEAEETKAQTTEDKMGETEGAEIDFEAKKVEENEFGEKTVTVSPEQVTVSVMESVPKCPDSEKNDGEDVIEIDVAVVSEGAVATEVSSKLELEDTDKKQTATPEGKKQREETFVTPKSGTPKKSELQSPKPQSPKKGKLEGTSVAKEKPSTPKKKKPKSDLTEELKKTVSESEKESHDKEEKSGEESGDDVICIESDSYESAQPSPAKRQSETKSPLKLVEKLESPKTQSPKKGKLEEANVEKEKPPTPKKKKPESDGKEKVKEKTAEIDEIPVSKRSEEDSSEMKRMKNEKKEEMESEMKESKKSKKSKKEVVVSSMVSDEDSEGEEKQYDAATCWPEVDGVESLWANRKGSDLLNALSSAYSVMVGLGECEVNLPNELVISDMECVWQQIAARNKRLTKRFNKFKSLFTMKVSSGKKKKAVAPQEEEDIQFEEEHEFEHDEDEIDEGEEQGDEEEEEVDLFNMKEEDFKDLENELDQMKNESEEENEEEMHEERGQPERKYRKTIVDDKFFSLGEMEEFLDREDRTEAAEGFFDDVQDDGTTANYRYTEFFGAVEQSVSSDKKKGEKRKIKDQSKELIEEDHIKKSKTKKSVHFAVEESDEEEEEDDIDEEEETGGPVLLGAVGEDETQESEFDKRQKKIHARMQSIEESNLAPRSWELSGEVTSGDRDENTLLEQHVAFDHSAKTAPIITVDSTAKLEALIIQRIKDKAFDDVERKEREPEKETKFRAPIEESTEKKSLAEVYEEQYQKTQNEETNEKVTNEKVEEIERNLNVLFKKLDALSHFKYIPPEVRPEVRIVSNVASLQKEEVGPMASTNELLMAPEEVKRHEKGEIKAKEERVDSDRARERRKKKKKQRLEKKPTDEEPKKKKKKLVEGATGSDNVKSTAFFKQLQQTVVSELKQKKTKSDKMKESSTKKNASAKYVL